MRSTILSFNFTTSDHTSSFPYPLQLNTTKEYEASLLSMETYNTLFNITDKNDKFSYNPGSGYMELRIMGFKGDPNEINLKRHADKTWTACRQERLLGDVSWTRGKVKSQNVARDKPMSMDPSPKLEHAAWQDGGAVLFLLKAPLAHALLSTLWLCAMSTAQDRQIDDGFQLVSHKVQHSSPGLACLPDKAKSRCRAPQAGSMGFQNVVEP